MWDHVCVCDAFINMLFLEVTYFPRTSRGVLGAGASKVTYMAS